MHVSFQFNYSRYVVQSAKPYSTSEAIVVNAKAIYVGNYF